MNTKSDTTAQWHRISPLAVIFFLLNFIQKMLTQGFPAVVVLFAGISSVDVAYIDWVWRGAILLAAVAVGLAILSYLRFRYRTTDDRVLLRQGILHREELEIEFPRVQNVTIKEPFYMRPLGLCVLNIDTAGSRAKEISIVGIKRDLALKLRDRILGSTTPELPEHAEQQQAEQQVEPGKTRLLVALTRRDVLIYGLTANFLLWVAVALGALFSSDDMAKKVFGWLAERFALEQVLMYLQQHGGLFLVFLVGFVAMLLVFLLLPLFSVIGALFRYDGYRLTVDGETYRKSSGLLTKFDDSLKRHKIQALVWKQNAIALFFKRISVQLRQASSGSGVENGELPTGTKSTFLIPALKPPLAKDLTGEFFPGCRPDQVKFSNIDRRRFTMINMAIPLLPVTLVMLIPALLVNWKFMLVVAVVAGILFMIVNRRWQIAGYGVDGDYGYVRHGLIGSVTTIFPLFKIQRVDVRQTPIQHRKGLSHLVIHLASHSVKVPYIPVEDANRFRNLALYCAESSKAKWY